MSTSGTYTFSPRVAEILDEAWERCGLDPATLDVRHIVSAKRSLNLLLTSELSADQINLWKVASYTPTVPSQGANSLSLPSGAIDVLEAYTRDGDGNDTPMLPISRSEWAEIPDKDQQGRPDRFWVDRTTGAKTLYFWQAQDAQAWTIILNVLYGIQDAGDLNNTADLPTLWQDVVCAGLAKRMAVKFAPDRAAMLEAQFMQTHRLAKESNHERAPLIIEPCYGRR